MVGSDGADRKCRLLIWLIKAGIHPASIAGFKLGVEINLIIGWVDKSVQAFTRIGIHTIMFDFKNVFCGKGWKINSLAIKAWVKICAIELGTYYPRTHAIDIGSCTWLKASKFHSGLHPKVFRTSSQI